MSDIQAEMECLRAQLDVALRRGDTASARAIRGDMRALSPSLSDLPFPEKASDPMNLAYSGGDLDAFAEKYGPAGY